MELEPDSAPDDQGINDELITDTCNSDRDSDPADDSDRDPNYVPSGGANCESEDDPGHTAHDDSDLEPQSDSNDDGM